jgi:hypothetical protein
MMEWTLGQILVGKNIITQAQLDLALKRQRQEKGKYLGQILFEMGVPQEEINKALDYHNKRKPIGQILVDLKIISPRQLKEVLEKQKQLQKRGDYKPLGMLLVHMGYTSSNDYWKALSKHFNMPPASLGGFLPCSALQKAVGEKYAQKNLVVVLENNTTTIKLALAKPTFYMMEDLKKALPLGKRIEFYLANPYEIETCLKRMFDPFSMSRYI